MIRNVLVAKALDVESVPISTLENALHAGEDMRWMRQPKLARDASRQEPLANAALIDCALLALVLVKENVSLVPQNLN